MELTTLKKPIKQFSDEKDCYYCPVCEYEVTKYGNCERDGCKQTIDWTDEQMLEKTRADIDAEGMTEKEAVCRLIDIVANDAAYYGHFCADDVLAIRKGVKALEYRASRALVRKRIGSGSMTECCPTCGIPIETAAYKGNYYCHYCGQKFER